VVVDELGKVDAANKLLLARRLLALCREGTVHQAVVADWMAAPYLALAAESGDVKVVQAK